MPSASLSQVVSAADVILRARITSKESRLTQDELSVRTYFAFSASRIFKDKIGIAPTRNTPQLRGKSRIEIEEEIDRLVKGTPLG